MINFLIEHPWVLGLGIVWSIVWKGLALWRASRRNSVGWFVFFLLVNTLGIAEIIYLLATKPTKSEAKTEAQERV